MTAQGNIRASWKDAIPDEDWQVYERAGFGRRSGFGTAPALLIIDVQYRTVGDTPLPLLDSIEQHYRTSCGEAGWDAVGAIRELLEVARPRGVPIVYPHVAPKDTTFVGRTGAKIPSLLEVPSRGYEFVEDIAPEPGDLLVPKHHASAFFGTALASNLIDLRVDTVILMGCTTSGCIRATAVDAISYNFNCVVIEDGVYDRSRASHNVNLFDIHSKYGDVVGLADARAYLETLPDANVDGVS